MSGASCFQCEPGCMPICLCRNLNTRKHKQARPSSDISPDFRFQDAITLSIKSGHIAIVPFPASTTCFKNNHMFSRLASKGKLLPISHSVGCLGLLPLTVKCLFFLIIYLIDYLFLSQCLKFTIVRHGSPLWATCCISPEVPYHLTSPLNSSQPRCSLCKVMGILENWS